MLASRLESRIPRERLNPVLVRLTDFQQAYTVFTYSVSGAAYVEWKGSLFWAVYVAITAVITVASESYDHDRTCYLSDLEPVIGKPV
jgi:hypothetical protein